MLHSPKYLTIDNETVVCTAQPAELIAAFLKCYQNWKGILKFTQKRWIVDYYKNQEVYVYQNVGMLIKWGQCSTVSTIVVFPEIITLLMCRTMKGTFLDVSVVSLLHWG